ncbi:MAG: MATE family efflux transporter [bacterium]
MKSTLNITEGPITRTVFSLAVPVVLGMLMEFALTSTDYFWVGKLGPAAQDAVTSSMVVIWTIFATMAVVTVGVTALVSRYVGAKDLAKVTHYIKQGLYMAIGLALVFTVVGFTFSPALLRFMDTGPDTLAHAIPYLRIFFLSAIFFFVADTSYATFRASGDTRTPTKVGIGVVLANMVLDPLLIFGWGPIPALGVAGASLATALAVAAGSSCIVTLLFTGRLGYRVGSLFDQVPRIGSILKIARIGLPSASQTSVFVFVYWFLIKIVHSFGESAGAAMGIGNRMESLSYLTCFGFSVAASTMVGQNLGAGKPDRAARCAWGAALSAIGMTAVTSIAFIVVPGLIASIFTGDPVVHAIAVDYLIILGLSQTAMALEIVIEGAFGGAGDTVPPMLVSVPGSLARIPLAYYLCFGLDWGINGVWWTLTITTFMKAAIITFWFRRGRWKLKEV